MERERERSEVLLVEWNMYMQLLVWIALPGVWKASWGGRRGMKGVSSGGGGGMVVGGTTSSSSSSCWKPCLPFLWAPFWKGRQHGEAGGRRRRSVYVCGEVGWQWDEEDHIRVCQVFLLWSSPCTQAWKAKQRDTEEGVQQEKRWKEIGKGGGQRERECVWEGMDTHTTHTQEEREKERQGGEKSP